MATIDGTRSGGLLGDDLRLCEGIKISREVLRGKLPIMALTHTMVLAVEDIAALAITCKCGVSVTIPVAGTNALDNEKRGVCVCGETLWRGGDDTTFARALIAARIGKLNRFQTTSTSPVRNASRCRSSDWEPSAFETLA